MVLDVKYMEWAAAQGLDTAKLKAAKVPIFGKWYFPELPAGVALVNLRTGDLRAFPEPMLAGQTLWVRWEDLDRAGFWPAGGSAEAGAELARAAVATLAPSVRPAPAEREPAPIGTLAILLAYLMVIVGLWGVMYVTLLQRG